jgi:D-alanyl-D-alanine carboxypeptidase (penicillin-binding protein 5/6)
VPIASLAKVMTALLVLRSHPLAPGAGGPTLQVTAADVALYRTEAAGDQSVLPVAASERLNERQLLQGLLLLGANNAAIMLARWDAGSQRAFVAQMNATARALGLQQTHFADASGLSPATVSTAADLLRLAAVAMAIPTFRHIVAEPQATLPVAGTVYNVDSFLGRAGIVGIKTGATTAAGGCDLAAAYRTIGGHRELVLAAVLGQQGVQPLLTALQAGEALVVAAGTAMRPVVPLRQGTVVANLSVPWAAPVPVVAARSVTAVGWPGLQARRHIQTLALAAGRGVRRGARVGRLTLTLGAQGFTEPLVAAGAIPPPPLSWRLLRR